MRITKKIISLLLVVSMLASFFAMTGFEASASLQNQQKTDFGIHFDDTTRKLKVLQLPDIQTSVSGGAITERTRETIRLLMQRYNPDVILLTGDQTQGGSTSTKAQWESAVGRAYATFSPYMKSTCKVIAMPGNHEYDFGSLNHQWEYQMSTYSYFVDWDNNFSTIDLDGAPGAGNVTVSASSTNKAVALNFAVFNSKGDDEEGYLRPGGDNDTAYQQIVDWYTNMNNTLAGSAYSYKAQVTGQDSAYVPTFASQHVILQEIFTTGAIIGGDATNGIAMLSKYSHLNSNAYIRLDPDNNPGGAMNEVPCPSTLGAGATRALYDALHNPGNCLGMTFGHDHDNYFDVVDDNGFHFFMGGALTQENYNTDGNPKGRYFEFTLNDTTGEVDVVSEVKSYTQLAISSSADVDSDRIEAINGDGIQLVNTLSAPKTVYVGAAENLADVRAKQEFGTVVQTQLLDYKTKLPYDQDLAVSFCVPSGASDVVFKATRTSTGTEATITDLGTETTSEGVLYKKAIKGESTLAAGEYINYIVTYTYNGVKYEIRNSTVVENIKQPAGYNDWFRGWRESNNSKHYVDLAYVSTLSGAGAYSYSRETSVNQDYFNSNTYYNYSLMIADVDQSWYNKAGDTRFSMYRYSPSRVEVTEGHVSQRPIYASPATDIYLDSSALTKVSATDSRLDTGVSIDFWIQKDLDRGFNEYVAGIGFYAGDQDYVPGGATIDPNDQYANYNVAVTAENGSTGSDGAQDNATIFLYDSYARQQSLNGLGTTHVNANLSADNLIGKMAGQYVGYPLVVDSEAAALALNGQTMTMFTGVRNKGNSEGGYRILLYAVSPFLLNFHTYDKSDLRELAMSELMNPRKQSDYPNATQMMWDAYMAAYQNALNCYAQIKTNQTDINNYDTALQNAIAALLNSNKGKPDEGNLLKGTSQFGSISVPPIIYVSGNQIQSASPYTDRTIVFDVPTGATSVSCVVVNENDDSINNAVKLTELSTSTGTHKEYEVNGYDSSTGIGTATAGGAIYYKLSYTLPQDANGDDENDTYTQYASSYVKSVPNKEGMWITKTRNKGGSGGNRDTRIHYELTVSLEESIYSSRGVSGIMALYGGVQGTSFHETVVNGTTNEYTRHSGSVYWAVGTANQWNGSSGYAADGRVLFMNDRAAENAGNNAYWDGLYGYTTDASSSRSDEYIVAHIYFDPQARDAYKQPQIKLVLKSTDGDEPYIRRYWDSNPYYGTNYGGKYTENAISNTGMFSFVNSDSWAHSDNNVIEDIGDNTTYTAYIQPSSSLSDFQTSYSRMIIQSEKAVSGSWGRTIYNYSTTGVAFVFNRVDRSNAHQAIKWITGAELVEPSALFNEDDMDPAWWSQWRSEIMKAYIACGNLWGSDFDTSLLINLWQNPVYKDADYSKLVGTLADITGLELEENSNESIPNYESLTFAIADGDDQRYAGQRYAKEMFLNNASDLIATIKNRVTVYGETDSNLIAASDAAGNLHDAHLDVRFQSYINDYADDLQEAWDKLRLAPADYTYFNKYSDFYSEANDTVTFMRDEYAGYNNDGAAKNYANEKALASGMYTYATYSAFVNSLNIDRTLKKPSESAAIGSLPRLYPQTFTYKNVTSPDVADTTACLYNTARDAYEALEFRKAGEYYSADGTYTEGGVTYYANYNKQDRGASYYYTPVFKTSYNSLSADIANAGYVVTDNKVKPTYTAGNNGDSNNNGTYDAGEIWVTNGTGEYIKAINPWTDASWGGASYGFKNAYEEHLANSTSTYQSTNSSDKWILALYVESEILPDIASVDYYYEKLVPSSYDMSQLEIQQHSYAEYEKGGSGYANLESYVIYDENGNELKDGAQWYTADTWADYQAAKVAQPSIIDGATLAENQDAINYMTQIVYQKRASLELRPMDDYRVSEENAILGETTFAEINNAAGVYNTEIANKVVKVFKSAYDAPQTLEQVQNNALNFVDYPYYTDGFRTNVAAAYTAIQGYSGKPMATNIANYKTAIDDFVALYNTKGSNLNGADYSGLSMLLNKTWIPEYEKYGKYNVAIPNTTPIDYFTGDKWYTAETWEAYVTARNNAAKFYKDQTEYNLEYGNAQDYGTYNTETNPDGILTNGLLVDSQGDGAVNVEGSINKATYDLLVAYYKLKPIKVSESVDDTNGSYADISVAAFEKFNNIKNATVEVLMVDENGNLYTDTRYTYKQSYVEEVQTAYNTITALASEDYALKYQAYLNAVNSFNTLTSEATMNQNAALIYMDGWNSLYAYLQKNATVEEDGTEKVVHVINSIDSMNQYFKNVYGSIDGVDVYTQGDYNGDGTTIAQVQQSLGWLDPTFNTAKQAQNSVNTYLQELYEDLTSEKAAKVPAMIRDSIGDAEAKISDIGSVAYDPYQHPNSDGTVRDKVTGINKYTEASKNELRNVVIADNNKAIKFWDAKISETGYLSNVEGSEKVAIDGTYADNIWAAAGLTTESGTVYPEDETKVDNPRYVLVAGGRFLDALKDAIAYAELALYKNTDGEFVLDASGNKIIKDFEVLKGDREVAYTADIFTAESIEDLTDALAVGYGILAETEGSYTDQARIDLAVFNILEESDIENTIKLVVSETDDSLYAEGGNLGHVANDYGLKYKPADLTYFNEELAAKYSYEGMSDAAKDIVDNIVWKDFSENGTYVFSDKTAYTYFTEESWDAYNKTSYSVAVQLKDQNAKKALTAADQVTVNNSTTAVYATRNALVWNDLDDSTKTRIDTIGAKIESLASTKVFINTYSNSVIVTDQDGMTYLTAPTVGQKELSLYGDITHITSLWETFKANYIEAEGIDITKQQEMIEKLDELQYMLDNLETKKFDTSDTNEFTEGVRNLVKSFIAGSYDFTGISSGVGTYTSSYLAVENGTEISDAEKAIRDAQAAKIQSKLNAIYTVLGSGSEVGDVYIDYSTGSAVRYETALDAVNALTMDLYIYLTSTPAQYAGFALNMRQDMVDFFNTTVDVKLESRYTATGTVYERTINLFVQGEEGVDSIVNGLNNDVLNNTEIWPTISQLNSTVGISDMISDDAFPGDFVIPIIGENGEEGSCNIAYLVESLGGYSTYYEDAVKDKLNTHALQHLQWITQDAVETIVNKETGREQIFVLGKPEGQVMIEGAKFNYIMNSNSSSTDGDWYSDGYGSKIFNNSAEYYIAADNKQTVTGNTTGGWFTDDSYNKLTEAIKNTEEAGSYTVFGSGAQAMSLLDAITQAKEQEGKASWTAANRDAFIAAAKADQKAIDTATLNVYMAICGLDLLNATDAYREVVSLIYAAMGQVPNYHPDNKTGIIINNAIGDTLSEFKIGGKVCGQVFNTELLTQLGKPDNGYHVVTDENGTRYYAPSLPGGYTKGITDVTNILNILQTMMDAEMYTIDKADLVNSESSTDDIASVKEEILAELKKLTLGLADLSLITSLTAAFLYNKPGNENSLGSYALNSDFFELHEDSELGKNGNAAAYRVKDGNIMASSKDFRESGFYDFSKYTTTSLNAVIQYLQLNYIINGDTAADASNYDIENKTGFNIVFGEGNHGTVYNTAVTQQEYIDQVYAGLVTAINNLELRPADTVALKAEIAEADGIKLNKDIYDYESEEGKAAWDEFIEASQIASSYENATIINEEQVSEATNSLSKAIRALKLNVDSYAPVVTIHNTQNDITKFYNAHSAELNSVISSANQMVAPSYMEPGLGGYTLYVYTNQINPHIVVSLEDAVEVANDDGSTRDVKASKPEKMTVTAQAMSGVTASVITPVLNENGVAEAAQKVAIAGENADANIVSTQTAKTLVEDDAGNETYSYAESSSAYVVLNPSFEGVADGAQSAVKYSIDASDSAVTKDYETGVISDTPNSANQFKYADEETIVESASGNDITVFVYYMNSMPADNNDSGVVNGTINASAVITTNEKNGIAANEWTNHAMLYRTFANPVRSWEFSETPAQLEKKNAAYYDPNFGENNFGSFVYILDPNAASDSFDYEVASAYFAENGGADAAKAKAIDLLKSNSTYISQFNEYVGKGSTTGEYGYKHYGATDVNGQYENWAKPMGNIDNGTLVFVHVADRFGNVCNRVIEWKNYDPYTPVLSTSEAGKVSVTEPGGSGVAKVDLFNYMGTSGSSLYIGYLYDMLHIDGPDDMIKYVSEDNSFVISAGAENAGKYFTVAVTDNAGNVGSVPVFADAEGKIVVTVDETFDNVANYQANPSANVTTESGEDLGIIEFVFNGESTVLLNYSEPSSIVKAGPDGNVFAKTRNVPLNIIAKEDVESIKLYNVDTGTEEIWTNKNAIIIDNGDGTRTWTVKYTFTEGEHNYKATAMVDGEWEVSSVDFDFTATTKSISVKIGVSGIGGSEFSFNDGNYSEVPVMAIKTVPYGSVVKLKAIKSYDASDFYYWKNDYSDRIINTSDTMEFVAVTNMSLVAQFTTNEVFENDKKLVVYVNNAENVVDSFELADGEDYDVPAAPSLPEHVFKSWSMTKDEVLASEEKMIVVRPVYSLVVKNTVTLTEGNWTATGAGEYETVGDERPIATISASATDEAGAGFLYWLDAQTGDIASYNRTYSFYVIKDTELTPVYGDASAVVPVPVARISTIKYDDKADKVSFFAERSVPAGYTMIQTGIVVTKSASVANNEEAFILDASGVSKGMSKSVSANGYYSVSIPATSGVTVYARAYVIYANADGDIVNYYSPVSSYTA